MVRAILGTVFGVVIGAVVVMLVEIVGHGMYPVPEGLNPSNIEGFQAYLEVAPLGAILFVVAAWVFGTLAGTALAMIVSKGNRIAGAVTALVMLGLIAMTLFTIPHPLWATVAGLAGPALAALLAIWVIKPTDEAAA